MANIINILISTGLKPIDAKVLLFMFSNPVTVSRKIERELILRQPDVSNTMKRFVINNWITVSKAKLSGKRGRPETLYTLSKSKADIFTELKTQLEYKIASMQQVLSQLKKLEV
jgi:predicted transcriptional regulator